MKNNNFKGWLYLLPAILFLGAFMVYPLIDVLIYSFEEGFNFASQSHEGVGIFMYEGDGVDFVILEEPPESRYYRKVNQIRVATDRYALFGMVRGEAATDARRKAEGRGFVYDAAESTDARLQLYRNSEENGAYYYEELTAYCQNGRATEYNYMAYRVDSPYVPDASPTPDQPA